MAPIVEESKRRKPTRTNKSTVDKPYTPPQVASQEDREELHRMNREREQQSMIDNATTTKKNPPTIERWEPENWFMRNIGRPVIDFYKDYPYAALPLQELPISAIKAAIDKNGESAKYLQRFVDNIKRGYRLDNTLWAGEKIIGKTFEGVPKGLEWLTGKDIKATVPPTTPTTPPVRPATPPIQPGPGGGNLTSGPWNPRMEKYVEYGAKKIGKILKNMALPTYTLLNYADEFDKTGEAGPSLVKAIGKTAYDLNPITVTKDISGFGLDISNKISDKRRSIIDSKSINNTLDFMGNIRNLPLNVLNKVTTFADNAMVNTAKSKMQEEKELRQRYDDKKFREKIKNSSASSGLDYLNVATKGLNTKSSQKSFDNMLIDMGFNPNEMTDAQKMKMIKQAQGLVTRKGTAATKGGATLKKQ